MSTLSNLISEVKTIVNNYHKGNITFNLAATEIGNKLGLDTLDTTYSSNDSIVYHVKDTKITLSYADKLISIDSVQK